MKINNTFYRIIVSILFSAGTAFASSGVEMVSDTVILKFKNNVEVIVITDNGDDLSPAYAYDLNKIFKNLEYKIDTDEDGTMTLVVEDTYGSRYLKDTVVVTDTRTYRNSSNNQYTYSSEADYDSREQDSRKFGYGKRTRTLYTIDVGMNNYLNPDGTFPDDDNALYAVKPWGSWYVGFAFLFKTNVTGALNLEWGGGIDWYTFKYQNSRTRMDKDDQGLIFYEDLSTSISPIKSKLSATYLNIRLIPMLDFSRSDSWKRDRLWNDHIGGGFRIGIGPYVGYRIDSWSKFTYKEDTEKRKEDMKDNYYLNNIRYGARFQIGFRGIDLFATYDFNTLYSDEKDTPKLNAFTFGFTL